MAAINNEARLVGLATLKENWQHIIKSFLKEMTFLHAGLLNFARWQFSPLLLSVMRKQHCSPWLVHDKH